ncbi:DUF4249 domain-containing protein [Salinimicrobium oceani]|uniref:DUF4249 domain-containing protein n=1 Tax=Salinimicrobium oceani TaxID=2722702 RepID=A0ABX1CX35_9FLAO|nr:DUF4249 domain-containing protein [Salinimicrobium oceani]NJW52835.1 DUF4249 domain-containing protein [Salinimicrobium oceani]
MKRILYLLLTLIACSCEEVVEVDLDESDPRLVVQASLLWNVDLQENIQVIRLTTTAPYFEEEVPPAIGATVKVTTETGMEYEFEEVADGIFTHEEVPALLDLEYQLHITYEGEEYFATETLIPVPQLDFVEQKRGGFSGDEYEFKVFYRDPAEVENYYLFRYLNEQISLQIYDDEFTNGNQTFAFFSDEDAVAGDLVGFQIQGISKGFYEYMFILRSQAGSSNGGPFQTQPSIVRGNIVNVTDPENFAFGYFRLSATNFLAYEVK